MGFLAWKHRNRLASYGYPNAITRLLERYGGRVILNLSVGQKFANPLREKCEFFTCTEYQSNWILKGTRTFVFIVENSKINRRTSLFSNLTAERSKCM